MTHDEINLIDTLIPVSIDSQSVGFPASHRVFPLSIAEDERFDKDKHISLNQILTETMLEVIIPFSFVKDVITLMRYMIKGQTTIQKGPAVSLGHKVLELRQHEGNLRLLKEFIAEYATFSRKNRYDVISLLSQNEEVIRP
eukprot:CAMPEP_0114986318 /NCGR_PEP_ID=MMETSP0216-20121206/8358_1 /TAXON_ID=223996 /ORGANISM="Protocruzia adherens, Strain Boccale" /LENGTH=140 /DNA_ID=CAMNT_0002348737 /DNA_START=245 /DNA_END=664 /DNA_ORIENTATION=-